MGVVGLELVPPGPKLRTQDWLPNLGFIGAQILASEVGLRGCGRLLLMGRCARAHLGPSHEARIPETGGGGYKYLDSGRLCKKNPDSRVGGGSY